MPHYQKPGKKIFRQAYLLLVALALVIVAFIIDRYFSPASSEETVSKNISAYIHLQERDFEKLTADTALLELMAYGNYNAATLQKLLDKKYLFFLYATSPSGLYNLQFWNSQVALPDAALIAAKEQSGFVQLPNGYYVWRKVRLQQVMAIGLIPVKWDYPITNDYLQNNFIIRGDIENSYSISPFPGRTNVQALNNSFLFSLEQKPHTIVPRNNQVAAMLLIAAALLVLLCVHLVATYLVQHNFFQGTGFLAGALLILRTVSYFLPLPLNFRQYELFDPAVYGSSVVLPSLGDLLINATLFLWLVLFIRHYIQEKNVRIAISSPVLQWMAIVCGILILLKSTFTAGHIIRSMVADSQISFDVVNFFTLNVYSVIGFLVLGSVAISYFFLTQIIIYLLKPMLPKSIMVLLLVVTVAGLCYLTLSMSQPQVLFELYLLIWLLLYLLLLSNRHLFILASEVISTSLIFWLFFFSISITSIIIAENNRKELESRKHYAEALSSKADPSSERLMNTVLTDFRNEVLAPLFPRLQNEVSNKIVKDSLLNENFSGYLNKYDTRIFTFDAYERPLYNADNTSFNTLSTILKTQGKPTAIPGLFYYDVSFDKFTYISKKDITDTSGQILGYVFILASPRRYKTDALYPELFLKGYSNSIENSPIYAFAVYNKFQLVISHNDYSFPSRLLPADIPFTDFAAVSKNGHDELWYKAGPDKVVIIVKEDNFTIECITLFSYLFCSFLLVTGIFWLLNMIIRSRLRWTAVKQYWQLSIRNQVHITIISISLLSFILVGVATILFFIDRYRNNNREKLSRTILVMQNEVRNSLSNTADIDDAVKMYDAGYREQLEGIVTRISEIHTVDVNLYRLDGTLQVSSLAMPYNKGIVSNKMDPEAFYHMARLKEIQFFKEEKIGTLKYLSNYVPIIDATGKEYAFLNIPYFTSQAKLRQEIAFFLVAIINLNAFIFLVAGVVALFITNRITSSFTFISNKMKAVSLGGTNEAIVWNRNDEIGELVKEYNKMVGKLDISAASLAKTEREDAWREMARQVAHEIKNPLTPMKLSLQFLQKAIDDNSTNVTELSRSVARTLVEQIDHLSQIAGEFSQFANIGNPRNEVFDLKESIAHVVQLYSADTSVDIEWQTVESSAIIRADKTHVSRLFTNLLQNAVQAVPDNRRGNIKIVLRKTASTVLVTVTDNGNGIPAEMQHKIFTPNFTTKTSGTGLGLAMSKSIVEQNKGAIWFDTQEGVGTSFYVELPLHQQ
ncbi:MAG TPA: HAMP domain-containing sensor histidine kinase [Ferruginibacter sp.]|nr:HAMP domain-containing sensor histidine kinase [Ferruginibacter sp.]HMP21486.1 HAMP domain-containing sensor histidine kinase [Ferruginibacter sp.]